MSPRAARASAVALALALALGLAAVRTRGQEPPRIQGEADPGPVSSAAPTDRIVLASGPLEGVLEPCRCTEGMLGGLPRRASLVARWAAARPVAVDLGDLGKTDEPREAMLELVEGAALEALATIGTESSRVHAVALGCTETRLGLARLERLTRERAGDKVVWLGTNLRAPGTSIRRSLVDGELQVLGVIDRDLATPLEGAELLPPGEAVQSELDRSKRVLVLYHGEPGAAERDLGEVQGIDAILCGHAERAEPARRLASGALLFPLETKGQRLHAVALGRTTTTASHDLDALVPDAREAREALDRLYEQETALVPELPKKRLDEAGGTFVGSESCRDCHAEAWKVWLDSRHGHALERLRAKDPRRSNLPECVRCHTVGFGFDGGWSKDTKTSSLDAVGCESCHGPGSNHVARAVAGEAVAGFGRPGGKWPLTWRARCLVCHDPANSPGFELEGYLEKIRHWKVR